MSTNRSFRSATAIGTLALAAKIGFVLLFAVALVALGTGGSGMMGGGMMSGAIGMGSFWLFSFVIGSFLALLALGYVGVRAVQNADDTVSDDDTADAETDPVARLRERYVAGELTDAEFERKLEGALDSTENRSADAPARSATDRSKATEK